MIHQPYIKIVCEGKKSEPNYFNRWLKSKGYKLDNPAFKAKDHSPKGVAKEARQAYKEALKLKIPAEKIHVWAVFDKDEHSGVPEAFNMLKNLPIGIAFSNICFEFWVLLHYERTTRQFRSCEKIVDFIVEYYDRDYAKASDHFTRLKDRSTIAIDNAKWLEETHWQFDKRPLWERNPYTDIHKLILSL